MSLLHLYSNVIINVIIVARNAGTLQSLPNSAATWQILLSAMCVNSATNAVTNCSHMLHCITRKRPTLSRRQKRELSENRDYVRNFVKSKKVCAVNVESYPLEICGNMWIFIDDLLLFFNNYCLCNNCNHM